MKIAVIGTGLYSTAFATLLEKNKENDIYLWTENKELAVSFSKTHKFEFLSKTRKFTSNINVTTSLEETVTDASLIFVMTSSKYFISSIYDMKPFYVQNTPIFVGTKGMDLENSCYFSEQTRKILKCNSYNYFSGPSFAKELIIDSNPCFTVAGTNKIGYKKLDRAIDSTVTTEFIDDLYGLEMMGVLKNMYAIATGVLTGLKVSSSTYHAILTRIFEEVKTILYKTYGSANTLFTYGGLGDFLMTTSSKTSRNFSYGKMIGSKELKSKLDAFIETNTVEGYENLSQFCNYLTKKRIKVFILPKLYEIVFLQHSPEELLLILSHEKKNN